MGQTVLHSRYDPASEAEKYIASLDLKPFRYYILIEPGLGHLAAALGKQFPSSKIISLHCSPFFCKENSAGGLSWSAGSAESLEDFLEEFITDADAAEVKLIEWKPSINAYGKACLDLASRTVECIRRITANRKTVRNFGRRWLRNALHNLEALRNQAVILPGSAPVLVCAAGPSLKESMEDIQKWKQSTSPPLLIAVSSAAAALLYKGIIPDITIAADGGSWARFHLTESFRLCANGSFSEEKRMILAASLTAALPSQTVHWPVLFLCDGSLWQELLLRTADIPFLTFPQRGTVSASALDLAFYASTGNVYIAGLDLEHRDLLTHARPYAFETITELSAERRHPRYSQIFEREEIIRRSGSNEIYAAWFKTHLDSFPRRLHTIFHSGLGIAPEKPSLNGGELPRFTISKTKPNPDRKGLIEALLNALDNPLTTERISKELGELLLNDTQPANNLSMMNSGIVKEALLELRNSFGKNHGQTDF